MAWSVATSPDRCLSSLGGKGGNLEAPGVEKNHRPGTSLRGAAGWNMSHLQSWKPGGTLVPE